MTEGDQKNTWHIETGKPWIINNPALRSHKCEYTSRGDFANGNAKAQTSGCEEKLDVTYVSIVDLCCCNYYSRIVTKIFWATIFGTFFNTNYKYQT